LKIRFQADNDLDRSIVRGLLRRQPAIDFRDTPAVGLDDLSVLHWGLSGRTESATCLI